MGEIESSASDNGEALNKKQGGKEKFNPFQKEYPRKVIIKFEGDMLDFNDFKRSERIEGYDQGQDRPTWGLTIMFGSYPFNKSYYWYDEEVREQKIRFLESKLAAARVLFV